MKRVTGNGKILITTVSLIWITIVLLLNTYGPAAQQANNMSLACDFSEEKMKEIAGREEFAHIIITEITSANGSILVHGPIKKRYEEELKAIVYADELPTDLKWAVSALDENAWAEHMEYEDFK